MSKPVQSPAWNPTPVEWDIANSPVPYAVAVQTMEDRVAAIHEERANELVWLLQHPPLYTAGTSAKPADLIMPDRFEVHKTGRGGQYTYHGPGQRVGYFMLDLKRRGRDVRAYVNALEGLVIDTLGHFGAQADRRDGRVGVWVNMPDGGEAKIAALGVRVRKWISFHGISINVDPDLEHFSGIVPCGISDHGVTSLADLDINVSMEEVDQVLKRQFEKSIAPILSA